MAETKKIINNPSITTDVFEYDEVGRVSAIAGKPLAGEGGGTIEKSDLMWKPTVGSDGYVRWSLASSATTPDDAYISGAQGPAGQNGTSIVLQSVTDVEGGKQVTLAWGDAETSTSAFVIPSGASGTNGIDGKDGISLSATSTELDQQRKTQVQIGQVNGPVQTTFDLPWGQNGVSPSVTVTNIPADPDDPNHKKGGTEITIIDATSTNKFSAWNGNDGTMAGAPGIAGNNGISAILDGLTYEVGLSDEFYKAVTSVSSKAEKTDLQYVSAGVDYVSAHIPSLNGYATEQYVQGASAGVTAWVNDQSYLKSVPSEYITETELSTALLGYLTKLSADTLYQPIGNYLTTVATSGSIIGTGLATNKIGLVTSAENALAAVDGKMSKPTATQVQNDYVVWNKGLGQEWTSFALAANSWANNFLLDEDDPFVNGNNGLSAGLVQGAVGYVYEVGIDTTDMTANKQYVFTTTGWEEIDIPAAGGEYLPLSGGTVSGATYFSAANGQNMIAVASAATLIGASRQTSANFGINNTAIGTTWVGVNGDGSNRGFLKYINGGNVGDLNGQGVQVEFGGSNGGEMLLKTSTSDPNTTTKVVNVPQSGYNNMTAFDATNGPNYMLRKLSDGRFDIGACVINVTAVPTATEANTYYFVYDIV